MGDKIKQEAEQEEEEEEAGGGNLHKLGPGQQAMAAVSHFQPL